MDKQKFEAIAINECLQKINSNNMNDGQFKRKHNYLMKNYPEWNLINMQLIFDVDLKQIKENRTLVFNSIVGRRRWLLFTTGNSRQTRNGL